MTHRPLLAIPSLAAALTEAMDDLLGDQFDLDKEALAGELADTAWRWMSSMTAAHQAHNNRVGRETVAFAEAAAQRILSGANGRRPHSEPVEEPDVWADVFPETDESSAEAAARDMAFGRWPE